MYIFRQAVTNPVVPQVFSGDNLLWPRFGGRFGHLTRIHWEPQKSEVGIIPVRMEVRLFFPEASSKKSMLSTFCVAPRRIQPYKKIFRGTYFSGHGLEARKFLFPSFPCVEFAVFRLIFRVEPKSDVKLQKSIPAESNFPCVELSVS